MAMFASLGFMLAPYFETAAATVFPAKTLSLSRISLEIHTAVKTEARAHLRLVGPEG